MAVDRALNTAFQAYVSVGIVGVLSERAVSVRAFVVAVAVVHGTKPRIIDMR